MPAHVHAPPHARPPVPSPQSSRDTRVRRSRHYPISRVRSPTTPPMRRPLPVPCLASSRAERTMMAFFVVQASTEGRRVLLSGSKTSRTRVTPIRRPIAASRDRGHTRRSLSLDGYGANTPRGRSSCAPLPHRQDSPQPAKNAPKNAPNAPHRQDSTPSLRNAPNAAACLVRVETKRCPTGTAGLLEERSYPP